MSEDRRKGDRHVTLARAWRFSVPLLARLQAYSIESGRYQTEIVNTAVREYLDRVESQVTDE